VGEREKRKAGVPRTQAFVELDLVCSSDRESREGGCLGGEISGVGFVVR